MPPEGAPCRTKMAEPMSMFREAVRCTLKNWTALQLAIQHGMGGPYGDEKERWMIDVIEQFYQENEDLDPDEVEDFIAEIMDNEFNTITEDGSLTEIAELLCQCYEWCQAGNEEEVRKHIPAAKPFTSKNCIALEEDSEPEEAQNVDDMARHLQVLSVERLSMSTEASWHENSKVENDDESSGWTVVQRRRK